MNAFLRRLPGPASPSSAASLIVLPLAAVGAASAAALIGACISSAVRRLVDLSDPIVPSEESVLASLRDDPLTMAEEVESFIREDDDAPVVLSHLRNLLPTACPPSASKPPFAPAIPRPSPLPGAVMMQ